MPVPVGVVQVEEFADCRIFCAAFGAQGQIKVTVTEERFPDGVGCDGEGTAEERLVGGGGKAADAPRRDGGLARDEPLQIFNGGRVNGEGRGWGMKRRRAKR